MNIGDFSQALAPDCGFDAFKIIYPRLPSRSTRSTFDADLPSA
ncbi:hypothetical protein PSE_2695 [Pseudovibrio sp. FO-BEG1]|nr:hypothetical protein PSE_2695 [Pseudovibrio sp. FO-BEG1]EEA92826.1 hypothetical protein PJE062_4331 [Pseudovibrio sp. JE062]